MSAPARTHYEVLGVAPTAAAGVVRQAYVEAARRHHPDRAGGDAEEMRALNDAWAVLRDPDRRRAYDLSLASGEAPVAGPPVAEPDPPRTDAEDLLADLEDDRAIGGVVRLPGWLSLLPPATFVLSIVVGFGGLLFTNEVLLAFAFVAFLTSCVMFLVSPFVALLASRSPGRTSGDDR